MKEFVILYREKDDRGWQGMEQGKAETQIGFLESLNKDKLTEHDWVVFEVVNSVHKDEHLRDGTIDHLLGE